jgi:hypothetical protein
MRGGIWSAPAPAGALTIVAKVKDRAGNWNERTVRVASAARAPLQKTAVEER